MSARVLRAGIAGGIAGGMVMAVFSMIAMRLAGSGFWTPLNLIAHTFWRAAPLVQPCGAGHRGGRAHDDGVLFGTLIAAAAYRLPAARSLVVGGGMLFAVLLWAVMQYGIWRAIDAAAAQAFTAWVFAVAHLLFGMMAASFAAMGIADADTPYQPAHRRPAGPGGLPRPRGTGVPQSPIAAGQLGGGAGGQGTSLAFVSLLTLRCPDRRPGRLFLREMGARARLGEGGTTCLGWAGRRGPASARAPGRAEAGSARAPGWWPERWRRWPCWPCWRRLRWRAQGTPPRHPRLPGQAAAGSADVLGGGGEPEPVRSPGHRPDPAADSRGADAGTARRAGGDRGVRRLPVHQLRCVRPRHRAGPDPQVRGHRCGPPPLAGTSPGSTPSRCAPLSPRGPPACRANSGRTTTTCSPTSFPTSTAAWSPAPTCGRWRGGWG